MDALTLPAERLTAHQPPALLVARALACDGGDGRVALKPHAGLDALQLTEAMAQALAVLMGVRLRRSRGGAGAASGMLVGAKDVVVARAARAGEAVEVRARLAHELGALQLYEVRALVGDEELARGELKVARSGDAALPRTAGSGEAAP